MKRDLPCVEVGLTNHGRVGIPFTAITQSHQLKHFGVAAYGLIAIKQLCLKRPCPGPPAKAVESLLSRFSFGVFWGDQDFLLKKFFK